MKKFLAIGLLLQSIFALATPNIWIDCDMAAGMNFKDVDDGYTLAHAIKNFPEKIGGISYSFGNTNDLEKQKEILKNILHLAEFNMQIYKGAQNTEDYFSEGAYELARFLQNTKEPNSVTILALSRMTILEGALRLYPEGNLKIKEVLFIGGRTSTYDPKVGKRQLALPDSNFWGDEKSFQDILDRKLNVTLLPADLALQFKIKKENLEQMKVASPVMKWMAENSKQWLNIWKVALGADGFFPFDLLASAYVTLGSEMTCHDNIPIKILELPDYHFGKKGKKTKNRPVVSYDFADAKHKIKYCYKVSPSFQEKLMNELLKK